MQAKKAIVIGAGAAGTSAAFRLRQAGASVRLIEREDAVCGRTKSMRVDDFILDIGAGLLPGTYKEVYRLMEDAGLKDVLEPMTSPTAVLRDGKLHYLELSGMVQSMLGTGLFSLGAKLSMAKIGVKALSMWSSLDFRSLAKSAPYDAESLAGYARRSLPREVYDYLLNPVQKTMYTMSGADASVVDFFWCAKNLLSPTAFCVKGGMGRIVEQVAAKLDVSLNTTVTSVVERDQQVHVGLRDANGRETLETVDVCVIATASCDVPGIDQGLAPASRRYLETLRYSMLTDLHLRLNRRPDEKAVMIMVPDDVDPDLCGILLDHNKGSDRAPPGKGSISVYFVDPWVQKHYDLPDDKMYEAALPKLERVMPGIGAMVEGYHLQRWRHGATLSSPGHYKRLADFEAGLDLQRRVQLAGDYFSLASVNTAVTSGRIAAERLAARYL